MRITPEMASDYVNRDIELCKRLIFEIFDVEKGTKFDFEAFDDISSSQATPDFKLDTLLVYLRKIHGFCLYCGIRCEDERSLATKCGP